MANEEIKDLNLVQKLAGIRKMVEVIRKNKSGYNYKYVSEDEILARADELIPGMEDAVTVKADDIVLNAVIDF